MRVRVLAGTFVSAMILATTAQAAFVYTGGWTPDAALFSEVGQVSADPGDDNHIDMLNTIYGGSFVGEHGKAFGDTSYINENGVIALRIADIFDEVGIIDQEFGNIEVNFEAVAMFGGYTDAFGIYDGSLAGKLSPTKLFDVSGFGYAVTGLAENVMLTSPVAVSQMDSDNNGSHFSITPHNLDFKDHMITYVVMDPNTQETTMMLFFEDKNWGDPEFDFDFNDLAVQVSVPEPASVGLLTMGLAMCALRRRRGA